MVSADGISVVEVYVSANEVSASVTEHLHLRGIQRGLRGRLFKEAAVGQLCPQLMRSQVMKSQLMRSQVMMPQLGSRGHSPKVPSQVVSCDV